ncbi:MULTISPECIES: SDR family oxidoreductase [unclassified Chelatococcus]|uniref:SDR family NAD(P)-dependent oxidoreductase n=1 Tax=unclassified Chelatococcus TaxID=2638111 RepID=UPI001BCA6937|nr:SDR family oxidoreductase [Chelatococcus sp.]MBS7697492.1 SDR family oxidoreductase [Chelatococcus sp. YT9]MBX3559433.1 SDR family oxidoreductase [Chelatococcus sp.]
MGRLTGKVAVITGGSTGIGRATAKLFVSEGASVYIFARRQTELDAAVGEIGDGITPVKGDVQEIADIRRLMDRIKSDHGRLDIVMANAGTVSPQTISDATEQNFDETLNTNLRGVYFTVSNALPLLAQGGSIILTSSGLGHVSFAGYGTYGASKAALHSLARTWSTELVEGGIRVNSISPGPIDTPILEKQVVPPNTLEELRKNFDALVPMKRIGRPEEVAATALFLASDESSYISGIDIPVDGGLLAAL